MIVGAAKSVKVGAQAEIWVAYGVTARSLAIGALVLSCALLAQVQAQALALAQLRMSWTKVRGGSHGSGGWHCDGVEESDEDDEGDAADEGDESDLGDVSDESGDDISSSPGCEGPMRCCWFLSACYIYRRSLWLAVLATRSTMPLHAFVTIASHIITEVCRHLRPH